MTIKINRAIIAMLAIVVLALSSIGIGIAQTDQGGSGVQITPTRTDLSLLPGEQKDFDISVKNITQGPITVKVFFNDFESDGVTGEPQIVVDPNRQVPASMRSFVKGLVDFDLAKDESKEIKITVDVPVGQSPGGYYGAIRFAAIPSGAITDDAATQVSLTASVASLVFTEVAGEVNEQIQINGVKVCKIPDSELGDKVNTSGIGSVTSTKSKCDNSSGIFFSKPSVASINIDNKGNGFARPFGRVTVTRGGAEVFAYELNNSEPRGTILPNTSRIFSDKLQNIDKFGRYTVTASVSYGQGGEIIVQKTSFWYIPSWVLLVGLGLLLGALVAGTMLYRKVSKNKR